MVKLAALCAALLSCLAFAPAAANAAPSQPPYYTINLITANGSGCPPGSTTVSQVNNTEFTISYSNYEAADGPGIPPLQNRENCTLAVNIGVPSGWTYGLAEVDYRGFAQLDSGAQGRLTASYYLAGTPGTIHQTHTVYGPQSGDNYTFNDFIGIVSWAPCHFNDTLNVDTSAQVLPGSSSSFVNELTMDDTNLGVHTLYHLSFRQC
jgi:hypothetical protein